MCWRHGEYRLRGGLRTTLVAALVTESTPCPHVPDATATRQDAGLPRKWWLQCRRPCPLAWLEQGASAVPTLHLPLLTLLAGSKLPPRPVGLFSLDQVSGERSRLKEIGQARSSFSASTSRSPQHSTTPAQLFYPFYRLANRNGPKIGSCLQPHRGPSTFPLRAIS